MVKSIILFCHSKRLSKNENNLRFLYTNFCDYETPVRMAFAHPRMII